MTESTAFHRCVLPTPGIILIPMNSPQVFQSVFLGENEHDSVVTIPPTGMDWDGRRLVDNDKIIVLRNDLDLFR